MLVPKLNLPEHVQINLDPTPGNPTTYDLVIRARCGPGEEWKEMRGQIARDIGALKFGEQLMKTINWLYANTRRTK